MLPAAPIYELEGIIDVLLAQIEKEQRKTEILVQAIEKVEDIVPRIRESVEDQYLFYLVSRN